MNTTTTTTTTERTYAALELLCPDPGQPRKHFDQEKLKELAESFGSVGIVEDLKVRIDSGERGAGSKEQGSKLQAPSSKLQYIIIDGERRWRAAKIAGLKEVPISVRDTPDPLTLQLIANLQRENLTAVEEAQAYKRRLGQGIKVEDLAKELGISRRTVFQRMALTKLDDLTRKALEEGRIHASVAALVFMVPQEQRKSFLQTVAGDQWHDPMSYRQAMNEVHGLAKRLKEAPFDQSYNYGMPLDKHGKPLIVTATCGQCPKRSGNCPEAGLTRDDICTQPSCYQAKVEAHTQRILAEAEEKGQKVLKTEQAFDKYGYVKDNLVDLEGQCSALDYKPWKSVLGKELPEAEVKVVIDRAGVVHQMLDKDVANAALKRTGKLKKKQESSNNDSWKKQQAKRREKEKWLQLELEAVNAQLVQKVEALNDFGARWLWDLVSEKLCWAASFETTKMVGERRGWKPSYNAAELAWKKMDFKQRVGLTVELCCDEAKTQDAVAKALKVDAKKIRRDLRKQKTQKQTKGTKKGKAKK